MAIRLDLFSRSIRRVNGEDCYAGYSLNKSRADVARKPRDAACFFLHPMTLRPTLRFNRLLFASSSTSIVNVCVVFNPSVFCICDEREWCTDYGTSNWVLVYFNSVIKRVKQCCCTLILLPKSTLNANLTTTNRFFTNDDWQRADDSKISNRTINTNRISNRTYDSKSNRITKLRS